ncbi:EAL domain-containing protein [Oryzibacter oryziterrae]|uniref:EAL domain-containing protein n=1 Tax=Oryzibacter oryziterrae TaxID=2766474 RepID=UPI001F2F8072|nr:EAL domain-containing protein [Oryzibacter oryziterrae]
MTGAPIALSEYVLSHHALSLGRQEARYIAAQYLERAEVATGEALSLLSEIRTSNHEDCSAESRQFFGLKAFGSKYVSQIGIADETGALMCSEPMGALAQPARLPATEQGDPTVMLGILSDRKTMRQAIVTLRINDHNRLVARLSMQALDIEAGASYFQDNAIVGVYLEDGAEWMKQVGNWQPTSESDTIIENAVSERYPIKVMVTASTAAALSNINSLRTMTIVMATIGGVLAFGFALWTTLRASEGDAFSRAVRNREFIPYYQPVFDLFTGEIRGCEVLVRWLRPDGTMVPPGQFLPYAEATGLIRDITRQLMTQTVSDVGELYNRNPGFKLSINLTAMHFNDLEIMEDIKQIYGDSLIRYEQLCFEVTEQHPLKDIALSRAIIGRIQALGSQVAIDDFGTGHGGLAYLQKLGVDIIKIDKMFIDHIGTDHSSQTIVDTLVDLGNQLGLGIIAEGVERTDQVEHLKSIGVATAQGYIYSPPLSAKAFLEFARKAQGDVAPARTAPDAEAEAEVGESFAALTVDEADPAAASDADASPDLAEEQRPAA